MRDVFFICSTIIPSHFSLLYKSISSRVDFISFSSCCFRLPTPSTFIYCRGISRRQSHSLNNSHSAHSLRSRLAKHQPQVYSQFDYSVITEVNKYSLFSYFLLLHQSDIYAFSFILTTRISFW